MEAIKRFKAKTEVPPLLYVRQAVWIIFTGWLLFLLYAFAAFFLLFTIIGIPFAFKTLKFAIFAFMPIGREPYKPEEDPEVAKTLHFWNKASHPLTIVVNVIWLVFAGWFIALAHLATAVIQALTIIGIGNAIQNVRLAKFALWPFGKDIRKKPPPAILQQYAGQAAV
eukprot:Phypoly_transcript_19171.p1 GENE.Phypoly_transcript_19171~~Phypoly_transcript_19171.p1  ORF type:complete len:168 (+),score=27.01 Phypoly_transcript_19171:146-649(+)